MNYRTDLTVGEAFCIFVFFHFPDSGLSVFIFDGVTVKRISLDGVDYQFASSFFLIILE